MVAKQKFTIEESMKLAEWGKANIEYMTKNPRNNVRRKIKQDTGMEVGTAKLIELGKMFNIVRKHGGKRPVGKNYAQMLSNLRIVAEAVRNIGRMHNLTWDADGTQRTHTPESRRWLEEARRDAVRSFIRVDDMLDALEKLAARAEEGKQNA